ncbi:hypothetical protein QFC20_000300 [Naganishia adeliensis]|uniref:Uncharacterized protein n=1 Tax=Naganishia adeliensis TaxID=92952 RepID=A0ACC2WZW4_9TREE|nr:hypothetical protein QFC20_000300 [Naganishia adeliensis]
MDSAGFMARLTANQEKTTPMRKTGEKPIHLKSIFTDEKETTLTYAQLPTLTLHRSPIPAPLASALFQELMSEAESYERHEWFLAGRKVQSPHTSGYYHDGQLEAEDSAAGEGYWYAGKQVNPAPRYPPLLGQAAALITPYVNNVLARRSRLAGEYAGEWRANFAAVNHYHGAASSVGWHADQSTYLGPCATIVSLSLGTPREFRLRPVPHHSSPTTDALGNSLRTYAVTLGHNSLCIMHAGTQELYKHTVPPTPTGSVDIFKPPYDSAQRWVPPEARKGYTSRINITFRFYRPDFRPYPGLAPGGGKRQGTPVCRCGIPWYVVVVVPSSSRVQPHLTPFVGSVLRADQKGKARAAAAAAAGGNGPTTTAPTDEPSPRVKDLAQALSGMIYFWQCQSSSVTGTDKGCGFFRVLDFVEEGRGPCFTSG